jgi:hypothetical protein
MAKAYAPSSTLPTCVVPHGVNGDQRRRAEIQRRCPPCGANRPPPDPRARPACVPPPARRVRVSESDRGKQRHRAASRTTRVMTERCDPWHHPRCVCRRRASAEGRRVEVRDVVEAALPRPGESQVPATTHRLRPHASCVMQHHASCTSVVAAALPRATARAASTTEPTTSSMHRTDASVTVLSAFAAAASAAASSARGVREACCGTKCGNRAF